MKAALAERFLEPTEPIDPLPGLEKPDTGALEATEAAALAEALAEAPAEAGAPADAEAPADAKAPADADAAPAASLAILSCFSLWCFSTRGIAFRASASSSRLMSSEMTGPHANHCFSMGLQTALQKTLSLFRR